MKCTAAPPLLPSPSRWPGPPPGFRRAGREGSGRTRKPIHGRRRALAGREFKQRVERPGDRNVQFEPQKRPVQIGNQSGPEQQDLPHLEVVVQFLQHGAHFLEPRLFGQVENLDIRMQAFADLGHAEEANGDAKVAPDSGIQPVDVFGAVSRSPLDAYRVGLRHGHRRLE